MLHGAVKQDVVRAHDLQRRVEKAFAATLCVQYSVFLRTGSALGMREHGSLGGNLEEDLLLEAVGM